MRRLLLALLFVSACTPLPKPQPPSPIPVPRTIAFDIVGCIERPTGRDYCKGTQADITVTTPDDGKTFSYITDAAGYVFVQGFPDVPLVTIGISAPGYIPLLVNMNTADLTTPGHNFFVLTPAHVNPSIFPLNKLAEIRGAMWPTVNNCPGGLFLPFGPRPMQPTNIIATVFITNYSPEQQRAIIACLKALGYTHVVMGPLVDSDGYHGQYQPNDWRGANFEKFLDAVQMFWDNGLAPVVFLHPDGWSFEQTRDELTPLLMQPRAQRLIRIVVPHGWEPCKYECSSFTWAAFGSWARTVLPEALVLLHTVADVDAPVGTDGRGDDNGHPNAEGWARVVPYFHGWLVQNAAFKCPLCTPNGRTNFQNFQDQFNPNSQGSYWQRFHQGYAGWPTTSAWGNAPLRIYAGEYRSYWTYWQDRPEAEGVSWGDAAIAAGADGYLDGGTVAVPAR